METISGVCRFCASDNIVLNSEHSSTFLDKITRIFDGIDPTNVDLKFKVCPSCMYKATLLELKKDVLIGVPDATEVEDQCKFCENVKNVLKVKPSNLNYRKFEETNAFLWICDCCYFAMDTAVKFRETLISITKNDIAKRNHQHCDDTVQILNSDSHNTPSVNNTEINRNKRKRSTDLSFLSKFVTLSKSGLSFNDEIKQDKKFFYCIPFARVQLMELCNMNKDDNIVENDEMNLTIESKTDVNEDCEIEITDMSFENPEETPKKKKKVHFDETPTIIIPEDHEGVEIVSPDPIETLDEDESEPNTEDKSSNEPNGITNSLELDEETPPNTEKPAENGISVLNIDCELLPKETIEREKKRK